MSTMPPKVSPKALIQALMVNIQAMSMDRASLARGLGLDPPGRDINKDCGYPIGPDVTNFREMYGSFGLARRANDAFSDECWAAPPTVYQKEDPNVYTQFERQWDDLNFKIPIWTYLNRLDRLAGIGRYGCMLLGLDDGADLNTPVQGVNLVSGERAPDCRPKKLMYLRTFSEDTAQVIMVNGNPRSPRYNQPELYGFTVQTPEGTFHPEPTTTEGDRELLQVHWTRVIHFADNCESSVIYGVPRMQPIFNYLLDLRKIAGSSAEMFWRGGFPPLQFVTHPDVVDDSNINYDDMQEEMLKLFNHLSRTITAIGGEYKSLAPTVADPTNHVAQQLMLIAASLQMPVRILVGTEAGHLASTQDAGNWNRKVARRNATVVDPLLIRPTVDRFQAVGVLPPVKRYVIDRADVNTLTDAEKVEVALKKTQALMQYTSGGVEATFPLKPFLTLILGLSGDQADEVITLAAKKEELLSARMPVKIAETTAMVKATAAKTQGGGRKVSKKPAGRPAKKSPRS